MSKGYCPQCKKETSWSKIEVDKDEAEFHNYNHNLRYCDECGLEIEP